MLKAGLVALVALIPLTQVPVCASRDGDASKLASSASAALAASVDSDRLAIEMQLARWRKAWSTKANTAQPANFNAVYVAGDAVGAVAVSTGFTGWQIARLGIERVEVAGDAATSTVNFVRGTAAKGGVENRHEATHVWRRVEGEWRIEREHIRALPATPERVAVY
jgi:ketosteroid isomerase-like protein